MRKTKTDFSAYVADFETTTSKVSEEYSKVWLWGIKGMLKGDRLKWGIDLYSFFDTIKENEIGTLWFHNLTFDGNYIYKFLLDEADFKFINTIDPENEFYKLQENEYTTLEDERGSIYSMTINWKGFQIHLLDSYKVLMASVENLGKNLGLEKLEIVYDDFDVYERKQDVPRNAIVYLERDIDVVIKTLIHAFGLYEQKMTRAGMAYNDFVNFYNNDNADKSKYDRRYHKRFALDFGDWIKDGKTGKKTFHNVLTREQWLFVNKSYQGGYTYWNQSITNKEIETPNGISYDVNSLYPSVMENYKMPYGKPLTQPPNEGEYITLYNITIISAKVKKKNYPPLIKKRNGRYGETKYLANIDKEYLEYTFWEEELEFILDKYNMKYVINEKMYFKVKWVFRNWLSIKKELKINATNKIERDFHKGIYNSTYGKFAQNIRLGARVILEDGFHVDYKDGERWLFNEDNIPHRKLSKVTMRYGKRGQYKHDSFFVESPNYKYIPIASYITSQARLILWRAMYDNLDIWLYSDTDSCYFSDIPKNIQIHESKFGYWKGEYKFKRFKVLRAKAYIFETTHAWNKKWVKYEKIEKKVSGVSKEGKEKINFENFYLGSIIPGGKRGVKNVRGGKLIYNTDFKLGEMLFL